MNATVDHCLQPKAGLADLHTLVQSTMNIASYHRGSLASGSYMGPQSSGQETPDIVVTTR